MDNEHSETETRNLELVQAGFEAWRDGTGSVYDLLAPTAHWTIVGNSVMSKRFETKQEFMDQVIRPFNARMSSRLVPEVRGLYADDDMVIALFDATGTARDGQPYTNTYSWYLRMKHDTIVEATAFFDSVEFNKFWTRVVPAV